MARFCNKCNKKFGFFEEDYNGMCKNCYEANLKKIEENERIKEEKSKEKNFNILRDNICNNSMLIELYNTFFSYDFGFIKYELKEEYKETYKLLQKIIEEFILRLGSSELSISKTFKIFSNYKFFNWLMSKCLKDYNYEEEASYYQTHIDNFIKEDWICTNLWGTIISIMLNEKVTIYSETVYKMFNEVQNDDMWIETKFFIIYFLAFRLIYATIFFQNLENFEKNEELYTIYSNLRNEEMDISYIIEKLYPIYKEYYIDTFKEKLTETQFSIIIGAENFNSYYKSVKDNLNTFFEEAIESVKSEKTINKEILIHHYKEINSKTLYEMLSNNVDNKESVLCFILLKNLESKIKFNDLLEIISNKEKLYKEFENHYKTNSATEDRERFLRGDFSKEKEIQKQSVEYSNIQNGYEFEQYVADLYKKLGYKIEEVTKKSGDQRSRCYCL